MREGQTPLKTKAAFALVYPISRKDPATPAGWQSPQAHLVGSCGPTERGAGPRAQAAPSVPQQTVSGPCSSWSSPAGAPRFVTRRHGDAGQQRGAQPQRTCAGLGDQVWKARGCDSSITDAWPSCICIAFLNIVLCIWGQEHKGSRWNRRRHC